jgi:hypothetical protein
MGARAAGHGATGADGSRQGQPQRPPGDVGSAVASSCVVWGSVSDSVSVGAVVEVTDGAGGELGRQEWAGPGDPVRRTFHAGPRCRDFAGTAYTAWATTVTAPPRGFGPVPFEPGNDATGSGPSPAGD